MNWLFQHYKEALFKRKEAWRIFIRALAFVASGVAQALAGSNLEGEIRALGLILSNLQVIYHFLLPGVEFFHQKVCMTQFCIEGWKFALKDGN